MNSETASRNEIRHEGQPLRRHCNCTNFQSRFRNEFIVTAFLGHGGFGCVFGAKNHYDDFEYAVKRISVDSRGETSLKKALNEVRAMAKLNHPGVVQYHSPWVEKPTKEWQRAADSEIAKSIEHRTVHLPPVEDNRAYIYIQMELCKWSLASWMSQNANYESRDLARMMSWFGQIVSAVAYIHKQGLIHRDLKPSNILFAEDNKLKICDLGIATERSIVDGEEVSIIRTHQTGTRLYMSPEQRSGLNVYSSKTDVFTLGLILAELCCVMNDKERYELFKDYRKGKQKDVIKHPATAELLRMLTQKKSEDRPTCAVILAHMDSNNNISSDHTPSSLQERSINQVAAEKSRNNESYQSQLEAEVLTLRRRVQELSSAKNCSCSHTSSAESLTSTRTIRSKFAKEFAVIQIVEASGSTCVYKVKNRLDEWIYAVKRISFDSPKEVRAMAQLDHPGLIRYNSTWSERSSDEKWCDYSLGQWLSRNPAQSSRPLYRMMSWFKQLLSAVDYIHEKNMIHRDVKPSNILFMEEDRLKVSDLGIVTARNIVDGEEIAVTRTEGMGTPAYLAPEQANLSASYDSKVDVYALGLVFAEMCVPLTAAEKAQAFKNVMEGRPELLNIDPIATTLIRMLTQHDPKRRPTCRYILDHPLLN